jgi:hypothetical protein
MKFEIRVASCEEHRPTQEDLREGKEHALKMAGQIFSVEAENREDAIEKAVNHILYKRTPYEKCREEIEDTEWPVPERESWPIGIVQISYKDGEDEIVEKYCDPYHIPNPLYKYKHTKDGKLINMLTINTDTNPAYVDNALVNIEKYILSQIDEEEDCPEKQAPYRQILLDFVNRYGQHVNYGAEIKNWRSK